MPDMKGSQQEESAPPIDTSVDASRPTRQQSARSPSRGFVTLAQSGKSAVGRDMTPGRPLSPERWSRSAAEEEKLMDQWDDQRKATSRIIKMRKEAERMQREARQRKDHQVNRWNLRQFEKAKFTDEQRSWWEETSAVSQRLSSAGDISPSKSRPHSPDGQKPLSAGEQRKIVWGMEQAKRQQSKEFEESMDAKERAKRDARYKDNQKAWLSVRESSKQAQVTERRDWNEAVKRDDAKRQEAENQRKHMDMSNARTRLAQTDKEIAKEADATAKGRARQAEQRAAIASAHKAKEVREEKERLEAAREAGRQQQRDRAETEKWKEAQAALEEGYVQVLREQKHRFQLDVEKREAEAKANENAEAVARFKAAEEERQQAVKEQVKAERQIARQVEEEIRKEKQEEARKRAASRAAQQRASVAAGDAAGKIAQRDASVQAQRSRANSRITRGMFVEKARLEKEQRAFEESLKKRAEEKQKAAREALYQQGVEKRKKEREIAAQAKADLAMRHKEEMRRRAAEEAEKRAIAERMRKKDEERQKTRDKYDSEKMGRDAQVKRSLNDNDFQVRLRRKKDREEAQRATLLQRRKAWVNQESERLAIEQDEMEVKEEERRQFRAAARRKVVEHSILNERLRMEQEEIQAEFALGDAKWLNERVDERTEWADGAESLLREARESVHPDGMATGGLSPTRFLSPGRTAREAKMLAAFGRPPHVGDESQRSTQVSHRNPY